MGVKATTAVIPDEGQGTWADDTRTWGTTTNTTWGGWSPQGGGTTAATPATATVTATSPDN
jgi:hypothetical protein